MELVAPAGNIEKLSYAYTYGADASYIGLKRFSLRIKADNFYEDEYKKVIELKKKYPRKKLFCALNISFHNSDIDQFIKNIDYFKQYPIDSFIIQDLGIVPIVQKNFPDAALHLSTQASCMNREAMKMYHSLGFKRVVLGREVSLSEVREIKDAVPEMEIEAFCHGAMCVAYSGRCLMSAYLTGRSAQSGFCSHTCRWDYDVLADKSRFAPSDVRPNNIDAASLAQSGALVLREHKRPNEYFPVFEGDTFTAVLSSKDLCMIDHLDDMKNAGVDAIKIEGRMKSVYYVALVTRAYRKALDALDKKITAEEAAPFIASLDDVAHRESTTGFYYNRADADKTTIGASDSPYMLAATVGEEFTKEETDAFFEAGAKMTSDRKTHLESMHPAAREAVEKDYAEHPEKCPPAVERREGWKLYHYNALNKTDSGVQLELISPDIPLITLGGNDYIFADGRNGAVRPWVNSDHNCVLYTKHAEQGMLVRIKDPDYIPGVIRDTGR
jgi:putative protease